MRRFVDDEHGVTAVEYGLITVTVVAILVIMMDRTGGALDQMVRDVTNFLVGATGVAPNT